METFGIVVTAELIVILIGFPLGIIAARYDAVDRVVRPVLDFMQTMPAFVYLIPAVMFFGLGMVPGVMATVIFALPPLIRLTNLGIRQVPHELVEAAESFGSSAGQMLWKVQLPVAMPTVMAGLNQSIMLALSMVVIGAMIGAGGLGSEVLRDSKASNRRRIRERAGRRHFGHHSGPDYPKHGYKIQSRRLIGSMNLSMKRKGVVLTLSLVLVLAFTALAGAQRFVSVT